jgi:hypothetical protein
MYIGLTLLLIYYSGFREDDGDDGSKGTLSKALLYYCHFTTANRERDYFTTAGAERMTATTVRKEHFLTETLQQ